MSKRVGGGAAMSLAWLTSRTPRDGVDVAVEPPTSKPPVIALSSNSTDEIRALNARSFMRKL
jgi:hypothetical protein